jgi:hypothetical protein
VQFRPSRRRSAAWPASLVGAIRSSPPGRYGCRPPRLAVDTSGHAWAWGLNKPGKFCNGTTRATDVPKKIPLPGRVTTLAGANAHAVFDAGGTVYTCGANHLHQSDTPVPVKGLPSGVAVTELVSGFGNAGALVANGQYYDWGNNAQGQLGNGATSTSPTAKPQHVLLPGPVVQVYQGGSAPRTGRPWSCSPMGLFLRGAPTPSGSSARATRSTRIPRCRSPARRGHLRHPGHRWGNQSRRRHPGQRVGLG